MNQLAIILLLVIYVEAITEIIVASDIMNSFRTFMYNFSVFTSTLISCGYCVSVWSSMTVAWIVEIVPYQELNFVIMTFCLHRLSNLWHELNVRWLKRYPILISLLRENNG